MKSRFPPIFLLKSRIPLRRIPQNRYRPLLYVCSWTEESNIYIECIPSKACQWNLQQRRLHTQQTAILPNDSSWLQASSCSCVFKLILLRSQTCGATDLTCRLIYAQIYWFHLRVSCIIVRVSCSRIPENTGIMELIIGHWVGKGHFERCGKEGAFRHL
jgi:hypothetical protein